MTDISMTDEARPAQAQVGGEGEDVRADHVEIVQGGANSIDAQTVTVQQGGAGNVRAREVTVTQGGIGIARAERVSLSDRSGAFAVVADDATVDESSNVVLLIARNASGTVRPLIDWRAAAAFGGAIALVTAVLRRAR